MPIKQENNTMRFAFASVVSIKEIKKGEKLTHKNIWVKRPEPDILRRVILKN